MSEYGAEIFTPPTRRALLQLRGATVPCGSCEEPRCTITHIVDTRTRQSVTIDTTETTQLAQQMLDRAGLSALTENVRINKETTLYDPNVCRTCGNEPAWYQTESDYDAPLILAEDDILTTDTWAAIHQRWMGTAFTVAAFGFDHPCEHCTRQRTWVVGLRPWPHHQAGDFIQADQPTVVRTLRAGVDAAGRHDLANQLRDRPPGLRGASYNANACGVCNTLDGWSTFEGIVTRFFDQPSHRVATGPITRGEWETLITERHSVWCE